MLFAYMSVDDNKDIKNYDLEEENGGKDEEGGLFEEKSNITLKFYMIVFVHFIRGDL